MGRGKRCPDFGDECHGMCERSTSIPEQERHVQRKRYNESESRVALAEKDDGEDMAADMRPPRSASPHEGREPGSGGQRELLARHFRTFHSLVVRAGCHQVIHDRHSAVSSKRMAKPIHGRADVEAQLGYVLDDRTWEQLENLGHADELAEGQTTPRDVADLVRNFGATWTRHRLPPADLDPQLVRSGQLYARSLAIGAWVARAAADDPKVTAFRRRHLSGRLLPEHEIGAWVAEQDRLARPADWPVPIDLKADENATYRATADARLADAPHVQFAWMERTDTGWIGGRWPVPDGSVLASLAELATELHQKWQWREHEAVAWVLSGIQPDVLAIEGRSNVRRSIHGVLGSYDVLSRITIEVDPVVTPDQLAGWWRSVRRRSLDHRYRPMSDKHLELARFAASRPETTTWDQDRLAWNRAVEADHPNWRYEHRRNYHRDAIAAVRRLLSVGVTPTK